MTRAVDYDVVAPLYDRRYEANRYEGVEDSLRQFIGDSIGIDAADVGCGTGHWLQYLHGRVRRAAGTDVSAAMLHRARAAAPAAHLARGRAEALPWIAGSFDRVICINALHHFDDAAAFMVEARRVLRPRGAVMTIGLDPHGDLDRWWIYDYFESALRLSRARFLPAAVIREQLNAAGFSEVSSRVAHHIRSAVPFSMADERGMLDRRSTSQLMVIGDEEFREGVERLRARQPVLRSDLRLWATVGLAG